MIRALKKTDLPRICEIEQAVHVVPWTPETFHVAFQAHYQSWVEEVEGKVIGFIIVSLTADECHILNIAIAREYQHQGYGKKLIQFAIDQTKQAGASIIYLEVRRSNTRAISLYQKLKFHRIGERKNYYPTLSGQEDALIFAKSLREPAL